MEKEKASELSEWFLVESHYGQTGLLPFEVAALQWKALVHAARNRTPLYCAFTLGCCDHSSPMDRDPKACLGMSAWQEESGSIKW